MNEPYVLQAAVNLARLTRCFDTRRMTDRRRDLFGTGLRRRRQESRAAGYQRAVRDALRGLGASLRLRGVEPLDVTAALRDIVELVVRLAALGDPARYPNMTRRAVQWGIEGYNGAFPAPVGI
jgi:hypothetical protein